MQFGLGKQCSDFTIDRTVGIEAIKSKIPFVGTTTSPPALILLMSIKLGILNGVSMFWMAVSTTSRSLEYQELAWMQTLLWVFTAAVLTTQCNGSILRSHRDNTTAQSAGQEATDMELHT
jgi:hypothetical protein